MSKRTITAGVRQRRALFALVILAALAFAPTAAATPGGQVYTPGAASNDAATNGAALTSAVQSADGDSTSGLPDVIQLCDGCVYAPTAPLTLSGNIEVTGDPQAAGNGAIVNGGNVNPLQSDFITVAPGADVIFKSFEIQQSSAVNYGVIVNNATAEVDNMALIGNAGTDVVGGTGSTTFIDNSFLGAGSGDGIEDKGGRMVLNNSDIEGANGGGDNSSAGQDVELNNSLIIRNNLNGAHNCTAPAQSAPGSIDTDGTCGISGPGSNNTSTGFGSRNSAPGPHGGPTPTLALPATSSAKGSGNPSLCPTADQRFFTFTLTNGTCDVGSYQSNQAAQDTTAPVCTLVATNYPSGQPANQEVNAQAGGSGLGPDAVFMRSVTITNGSVSYPSTAGSFDMSYPGVNTEFPPDFPSRSPFQLMSTKSNQSLRTTWSFDTTSWAGITTHCS